MVVSTLVDRANRHQPHRGQLAGIPYALADDPCDRRDHPLVVVFPLGCPTLVCRRTGQSLTDHESVWINVWINSIVHHHNFELSLQIPKLSRKPEIG